MRQTWLDRSARLVTGIVYAVAVMAALAVTPEHARAQTCWKCQQVGSCLTCMAYPSDVPGTNDACYNPGCGCELTGNWCTPPEYEEEDEALASLGVSSILSPDGSLLLPTWVTVGDSALVVWTASDRPGRLVASGARLRTHCRRGVIVHRETPDGVVSRTRRALELIEI